MTRTHFNFAFLIFLLLAAIPTYAQGGTVGQIEKVKGKVSLVRGQAAPVPLQKHDTLQVGDEILTDGKSSATLRMPDGSTVIVYPNSRIALRAETGNWKEFLHVLLGNVRVKIEKVSGRPNPKAVTTPTTIIAVRGTIFGVEVDKGGDTQVGVEEGLVSVANQLHPQDVVMVKPGQSVSVHRDQRPTQPRMMQRGMPGINATGSPGMGSGNGMGSAPMGNAGARGGGGRRR